MGVPGQWTFSIRPTPPPLRHEVERPWPWGSSPRRGYGRAQDPFALTQVFRRLGAVRVPMLFPGRTEHERRGLTYRHEFPAAAWGAHGRRGSSWPRLPAAVRAGIVAMVKACPERAEGRPAACRRHDRERQKGRGRRRTTGVCCRPRAREDPDKAIKQMEKNGLPALRARRGLQENPRLPRPSMPSSRGAGRHTKNAVRDEGDVYKGGA